MSKYLKIISPLVFILSLLSLFVFKTVPTLKIWKEYSVLYTPASSNDSEVLSVIHTCGIEDEISLSGQYLPVTLPENSVEISMFKLNRETPEYNYYVRRNAYFFDKSNNYRLYYIPAVYKSNIYDCINILNSKGIPAGIDATSSFPWAIPIITVIFIALLSIFSKNKLLYITSSLISVPYLISNPFYTSALSCTLIILSIFFLTNIWKRKGFLLYLVNRLSIPAMFFIALLCSFSTSVKAGIFFIITLISMGSYILTYSILEDVLRSRRSFNPVFILSAKSKSIYAKKINFVMPAAIISSILFIGVFFLTSSQTVNSHLSKLLLPSANGVEEESLPQLEDYYSWIWNIKTFPYKSLNNNTADYIVEFPRYTDDNGFITESRNIMVYNQNFKDNVYSEIDTLPFNSIEKVIKSEGKDVVTGYASTSSYSANLFSVIMMIICFFVLLFIYFYTIIKKEN